jgi:predicted ATPase/transcriptional regulator with XRE-family HTH domain
VERSEVTAQLSQFGSLLLRTRKRAGLTQEGLAERSAVSAHTISNLEAGRGHLPRPATIDLLVTALAGALPRGQSELESLRAAFKEAAVGAHYHAEPAAPIPTIEPPDVPQPSLPLAGLATFLVCAFVPGTAGQGGDSTTQRANVDRLRVVLQAVPALGGQIVGPLDSLGGVVCVFTQADAAARAAVALLAAFAAITGEQNTAHVCFALHSGWASPGSGDFSGPTRRRAERMARAGHGGQVLLSQAARDLLELSLPEGTRVHAAGLLRFSVTERPQPIYQLLQTMQPADVSPLRPLAAMPHNLPLQLTSFVGREQEQAAVELLLRDAPLVTLVGTGGCGKTRLALAVAAGALENYADGVWFVELAAVSEPELVARAAAAALGLREESARPLLDTLVDAMQLKHLLLILDNCEQVVDACATLAANLLRHCPNLHLLATSREWLGISGETRYRVPSLTLPGPEQHPSAAKLAEFEAIRLFMARALAVQPAFSMTAANAGKVAAICRRLDGIPLAIELAAARMRTFSLEEIDTRLEQSIGLLSGGPRDAPSRHQTLHGALEWSWALLDEAERALLARLAVFAGGWPIDAARTIWASDRVDDREVAELLDTLVDKSLVVLDESAPQSRYRLLETVRQYAVERLKDRGEQSAARDRHLDWCLALAEQADPLLTGPEQRVWLERLETEHDNLRAALSWAKERQETLPCLRLAGALWRFWGARGHVREGRMWLDAVLATTASGGPGPESTETDRQKWQSARGAVLSGAGNLAEYAGDLPRSRALHEEALAARRALGDSSTIARSLGNLANTIASQGDLRSAAALFEEALSLFRVLGNTWAVAACLSNLGAIMLDLGDLERAKALQAESLVLRRDVQDTWGIAASLKSLGTIALDQGELDRAAALYNEGLALRRGLDDQRAVAESLSCCADVELARGNPAEAWPLLQEAIGLSQTVGDRMGVAHELGIVARVLAALDQPAGAMHVLAAADELSLAIGIAASEQRIHERDAVARWCASQLSSQEVEQARSSGAERPIESLLSWILSSRPPNRNVPMPLE